MEKYGIEKRSLIKIKGIKNRKKKIKSKVRVIKILWFALVIIIIIIFLKILFKRGNNLYQGTFRGEQTNKNYLNNNNNNISETHIEDKSKYFACLCTIGRMENLYARFLVQYYRSIGFEKFIFVDNNKNNSQVLSDVLQDI